MARKITGKVASHHARISKLEYTDRIASTLARIEGSRQEREKIHSKAVHEVIYWTSLIVLVVCNFVMSIVLIPFLLVLTSTKFYLLVVLLAAIFGFLFDNIINNLEHVEARHHMFAILFLPIVAIVNIAIMVGASNRISEIIKISRYQDPLLAAIIYAIVFLIPYVVTLARKGHRH